MPPAPDAPAANRRLGRAAGLLVAGAVIVALASAVALTGLAERSGERPPSASAPAAPSAPTPPAGEGSRSTAEQAFVDAYWDILESYNARATELLIANPLAEFDLVGVPLIDLVEDTRARLSGLPPLPLVRDEVSDLDRAMADTAALLRAVDPHGPRTAIATAYQLALDAWVEHVRPPALQIRATLGLPPPSPGDLQL